MITYRRATFDDVENIHKLLNDYAHEGLMLPRARNAIYENLRDYIVAIENNRLIGCGALHFVWDRLAEIRSLAVDPERKTSGIGRNIVHLLEKEGIERGVKMFKIAAEGMERMCLLPAVSVLQRNCFCKNHG